MSRRELLKTGLMAIALGDSPIATNSAKQLLSMNDSPSDMPAKYDLLVYGSTPGGIAAAVEAARRGCHVLLACPKNNLGGMAASGLCTTDAVRRHLFGGFVIEFIDRIRAYYSRELQNQPSDYALTQDGWHYEPSVAEHIFQQFVSGETNLEWWPGSWLTNVRVVQDRIVDVELEVARGDLRTISACTFIDATYEGDLAARAGVSYRVGRESSQEYGEPFAGIHYMNWRTGKQIMSADSGEASPAIQAFCYRGILTQEQTHRVPIEKPDTFEEHLPDLLPLREDFRSSRVSRLYEVFPIAPPLPNGKFNFNGNIEALTSPNCPGVSWAYPEAGRWHRQRLEHFHRDHALSLLWFLQHDPYVPDDVRAEASVYGLHKAEFVEHDHWPWQLYVRQGRRIEGRALLTQHSFTVNPKTGTTPRVSDPIALGEHSFDTHPCHDRRYNMDGYMEGVLWYPRKDAGPAQPGQIPYGALLPKHIDNLLVPVAMSCTHVAMAVLRMEPVWMTTGQVSGLAAAMSLNQKVDVANLDPAPLPKILGIKTIPEEK